MGQSQKKWDSRKFCSKKRDCPSKIGTVGKYDKMLWNIIIGLLASCGLPNQNSYS